MKNIILSHPTGNANVKGVLSGLLSNNMLQSFHTSIACFPDSRLDKFAQFSLFKDFKRRSFGSDVRQQTHTYPYKELGRLFSQRLHFSRLLTHETGTFSIDKCYRYIDNKVADYLSKQNNIAGIYAYEDCALSQFSTAKQLGINCMYDLPIGYWRAMHRMLAEEREKNPEWTMTLGGFDDSAAKLQRKDEELELTDVIYVASSFTKQTLQEYPGKLAPVQVISYGFPRINEKRSYTSIHNRKIKLLYVGGLSQRKGISYLFEAVKGLENWVELTVVGKGNMECEALKKALANHTYIPSLPHNEILALMAAHDVLIFPSLFEGFGLVVTEAMSQGTPVITTDRTCGPDIITSGQDSWLVEAGSTDAIRQQLDFLVENSHTIKAVGQAAMQTASKRPWHQYGQEMAISIHSFLNP